MGQRGTAVRSVAKRRALVEDESRTECVYMPTAERKGTSALPPVLFYLHKDSSALDGLHVPPPASLVCYLQIKLSLQ